jgi:hypothetical protein
MADEGGGPAVPSRVAELSGGSHVRAKSSPVAMKLEGGAGGVLGMSKVSFLPSMTL